MDLYKDIIKPAVDSVPGWALTSVFGALGGWLFGWATKYVGKRRPSQVLLGLKDPASAVVVLGAPWGIVPDTQQLDAYLGMPIFGLGPLVAYHRVQQMLATAYPRMAAADEPVTSRSFHERNLGNDLILIGFPKGNAITAKIMAEVPLPLSFTDHEIIETATRATKFAAVVADHRVRQDYGMLVRMPNPFNPQSIVLILAGCQTFGVRAACEYLKKENLHILKSIPHIRNGTLLAHIEWLVPKSRKSNYYQTIVKTNVRGLFSSEPELVLHQKLNFN